MAWNWFSKRSEANKGPNNFADIRDKVQKEARACVLLRGGDGKSKIGGTPDGISPNAWPIVNGTPLSFVAQIDLEEIHLANGPEYLPSSGSLLFFYDADEQPWGFKPTDRDGWRVIHIDVDASTTVVGADAECPTSRVFPEKRLSAIPSRSLPEATFERIGMDVDGLTDEEVDRLSGLADAYYDGLPAHQVGGFPRPVQSDYMELEAQLASNGLNCGSSAGYNDPRAKELGTGAKDWTLLLQLDSDDDVDMMWGDCGRLYFWIREQDARSGDFNNVWMVLQCS